MLIDMISQTKSKRDDDNVHAFQIKDDKIDVGLKSLS